MRIDKSQAELIFWRKKKNNTKTPTNWLAEDSSRISSETKTEQANKQKIRENNNKQNPLHTENNLSIKDNSFEIEMKLSILSHFLRNMML